MVNTAIMWIMAVGAAVGGLDRLFGNRLGLGKKFEEGFMLMGPTALSMAGIICLTPLISDFLKQAAVPLWHALGLDPALLGGILAIDMGGYQLSMELADLPAMGLYSGIVISATFGCTVSFTIPVGMGMLQEEERTAFAQGILIGLGCMPAALVIGGLFCGLSAVQVLVQSIPVFAVSLVLTAGIAKFPTATIKGFSIFAGFIRILATVGLIAGAVQYMTGFQMIKGIAPVEEAMAVVASIGVVMLGSLPVAEFLKRALDRPFRWIGRKTGMSANGAAGLLLGIVSPVPAITEMKEMDSLARIVNAAFLVCGASAIAAHTGFTFSTQPQLVGPLLAAKLSGGLLSAASAFAFSRKKR